MADRLRGVVRGGLGGEEPAERFHTYRPERFSFLAERPRSERLRRT
jgi:hypothetical protein